MNIRRSFLLIALTAMVVVSLCFLPLRSWRNYYFKRNWKDRAIFEMDRRSNIPVRFHGRVVDQNGDPLASVQVRIRVASFNERWAYETIPQRVIETVRMPTTDHDGRFIIEATGTDLFIDDVRLPGYRWLYETDVAMRPNMEYAYNRHFALSTDGRPWPYQPDSESPAVYVLVKDGVRKVRVKPSRGGRDYDLPHHKSTTNEPVWPHRPSLPEIEYEDKGEQKRVRNRSGD